MRNPIDAFDGRREAILVVRAGGATETITPAASSLLKVDPQASRDRPCWEIARLRAPDGTAFCGPDCAVWKEAREGRLRSRRTVILEPAQGRSRFVELVTVATEPPADGRAGVLHLFVPLPVRRSTMGPEADRVGRRRSQTGVSHLRPLSPGSPPRETDALVPERVPDVLAALSEREKEVLSLLAEGLSTETVAERLFISQMTVRNHVRHILAKLGVHRRIDAILLWLEQQAPDLPPVGVVRS